MRYQVLACAVAIGGVFTASAQAQSRYATPPSTTGRLAAEPAAAPSISASDAMRDMRTRLSSLTTAEERYWMSHGTYTSDLAALGMFSPKSPLSKDYAFAQVIFAGSRGWTGMATHRAAAGKSCVMFVGVADELPKIPTTMAEHKPANKEGVPVCDTP